MSKRARTRSGRWRTFAAVAAIVAVSTGTAAAANLGDTAATAVRRAERVDPPTPVVVIGDSAIAALRWVPRADTAVVGFEHTLDLESCRRLYAMSCRGREGRVPPSLYEALGFHGSKYQTLVVATGYNDGVADFGASFDAIVRRAREFGYTRIVWWTLRSDVDYVSPGYIGNHVTFAANNQVVRDRLSTGRYPEVVLADWGRYTVDRPEWFVTDGVHYRAMGAWAASDYLSRKMAFLEDRACPVPTGPTTPLQDPCPDPDVTGPVADIAALYPVGADGVLCYEVGESRRFECRDETHLIQLERELGPGMSGSDVWALQTRLIRLDLLDVSATGSFDPTTTSAVMSFQRASSLPVTGMADRSTLDALGFDISAIVTLS